MQKSKMFNMPKNAFFHCFHHQFPKFALETQIRHMQQLQVFNMPKKLVFAQFLSSIFENCSRNANKAYAAFANVQHADKTLFCTVFIFNFEKLLKKRK